MSGVGPVEPGEGTRAWDAQDADAPHLPARPHESPRRAAARFYGRHRRATLTALAALALLAGGGSLYATRPHQPPPPTPPFPSQVVDLTYVDARTAPRGAAPGSFSFEVLLGVDSGPPVTVTRITQPYAGLSLVSDPVPPFRTRAGSVRRVVITMRVTDCGKAPENAGLPFLDVTLRNTRAIQEHSFIPGPRYAQDLSRALQVACSNESR
ncbi:Tat pathway signal sequence domain protein [Streptomyces sp. HUAS ZL42]|uniref:Tat pathway signal sequence domain protein n=1 Tax=Streptomyces sp. HUAS ZL42 TaxID=3231715 RepID=UPI00345ECD4A